MNNGRDWKLWRTCPKTKLTPLTYRKPQTGRKPVGECSIDRTKQRQRLQKIPHPPTPARRDSKSLITNSLTNNGWLPGAPQDYDRTQCVDLAHLSDFLLATQPETAAALSLDTDNPTRRQFLERLKREIGNRGIIDVLRKGIQHRQHQINLFYGTPSPGNSQAQEHHTSRTRFSVTRQLRYSNDAKAKRSLDLALFINGLPIATMELKNRFTGQTVTHAVDQYRLTRDPREDLFRLGRCAVHFAVDDEDVTFCTELKGKAVKLPPFQQRHRGRQQGQPGQSPGNQDSLPLGSKSSPQMD